MSDDDARLWGRDDGQLATIARNLSWRYVGLGVDALVGLMLLPFNVAHLGKAAYGLLVLSASVTAYFSILDLGFGGALVRFVARYRAWRDARGLNEILSTMFVVYAAIAACTYGGVLLLSNHLDAFLKITPAQLAEAQTIVRLTGLHVSLSLAFAIFGTVINGFQRYHINTFVGMATNIAAAIANVTVLLLGGGLVALVTATTAVRLLALFVYRRNAYQVFPGLQVRPQLFRWARLKEVSGFSIYSFVIDWANRINYTIDTLVIGAFIGSSAVALWSVPRRLTDVTFRLTQQLNYVLFPVIVDSDATRREDRLRLILIQGLRMSLAAALPVAVGLFVLAEPVVFAWVGRDFEASVVLVQLLALVVMVRVVTSTPNTILKGAGAHRLVAISNSTTAAANLALSIVLVQRIGLVGAALGTLIPVSFNTLFVIFPSACRRVRLPIATAVRQAIWPAAWPATVAGAVLWVLPPILPRTLTGVAVELGIGVLIHLVLFVGLALSASERRAYVHKATELLKGRRQGQEQPGIAAA